ncbi:TPA: hypothetical protein ENS27_04915 [bacterium]|nr:hypothetical protein [bacterium]
MICSRIIVINDGKIAGTVKLKDGKVTVIEYQSTGKITNLEESGNIYIKVHAPSDKLIPRIKLIPQVIDVITEQEDDLGSYIVIHEAGMDIRSELASTIVYSNWGLMEMRPVEMTLEDAFLDLIRENVPEDISDENESEIDETPDNDISDEQEFYDELDNTEDEPETDDGKEEENN